jgi:DNA-binding SARP family transcriptional activator
MSEIQESPATLRVYLFGHFSVESGEQALTGLEARRLQEIFSYLLLNRHRRCSREFLANLFWRESSAEQSRRNLRQILWQLQTVLEPLKAPGSECFVHCTADWLQANMNSGLWLDVDHFERAWNETRHVPGKDLDTSAVQVLRDAIALHQGILLPDSYEDWCLRERDRLLSLCIAMLEKLMEYSEAHSDYEAALSIGSRILDFDRARETTHQQLMHLYYFLGRRVDALKQYQRCEIALLEELGASPSKSTLALYQRIFLDQEENDSDTEALIEEFHEKPYVLAHILTELQQVQTIQARAQHQVGFRIQNIERTLHTLIEPSEQTRPSVIPFERKKLTKRRL